MTERLRALWIRAGTDGLARAGGVCPESVRRYLRGAEPNAVFLSLLCESLGVNGDWLLRGRGPCRSSEIPGEALKKATRFQLVLAIGAALDDLDDRVDRLDRYARRLAHMASAADLPAAGTASTDAGRAAASEHLPAGVARAGPMVCADRARPL